MNGELNKRIVEFRDSQANYAFVNIDLNTNEFVSQVKSNNFKILNDINDILFLEVKVDDVVYILWNKELMSMEFFKTQIQLKEKRREQEKEFDFNFSSLENDSIEFFDDKLINKINNLEILDFNFEQKRLSENISILFGIDSNELDYTQESLLKLDKKFIEKSESDYFLENAFLPLSFYLGKVILHQQNTTATYELKTYSIRYDCRIDLPIITIENGNEINVFKEVFDSFTKKHGYFLLPSRIVSISLENPLFDEW